ncbi:Erythronate-4-phosphate dehydrogenase [Parasponia andersonii]|uniref:Erythronate-4-phosphate dehydrogenase n=1 Tax=Parasponia andersonii TaxID=3476 RepID=A0A2P5C0W5_PARAD|nr:Erythronate-4-phosphate dehydrogenase [Parasponia andersonii]
MAMKRVAISLFQALSSLSPLTRHLHATAGSKKIVGVFYYKGNEYAKLNPNSGIGDWLESQGHQYIVTDDKEGPNSHIPYLEVLITTPFHPAYVTGCNVVSVAEDELMRILILVRNFVPGYNNQVVNGDWNVAGIAYRAHDLEGKTVGTRLKPFNCNLLYYDRIRIDPELEKEKGAKFEEDLDAMLPKCDVVVINIPLTGKTRRLFDKERISKCKKGVLFVNNARGAIMDTLAVVDACNSGHIAGYSGDVWHSQPAPKDHPWRYMPNLAMTPHISGTTIDGQLRYAAGVKDMLERYFKGKDFPAQNYIVKEGELASQYQ